MMTVLNPAQEAPLALAEREIEKNPFLVSLGERVRSLRSRRGMTRKAVALAADVSERHLANLEYGEGNASILVLLQVAGALHCSLFELLGDMTTSNPEWLLIRELLENADEAALRRARIAIGEVLGTGGGTPHANPRVALIGLRGAGKSSLGQMLADDLGFPFVELSREIEKFAGCSVNEIQNLYGMNAYRRYERRALEEAIQIYPEAVIATPPAFSLMPIPKNKQIVIKVLAILAPRRGALELYPTPVGPRIASIPLPDHTAQEASSGAAAAQAAGMFLRHPTAGGGGGYRDGAGAGPADPPPTPHAYGPLPLAHPAAAGRQAGQMRLLAPAPLLGLPLAIGVTGRGDRPRGSGRCFVLDGTGGTLAEVRLAQSAM